MSTLSLQFYSGHKGQFGHEYFQFSIRDGVLQYSNNSNYKKDEVIKKQVTLSKLTINEIMRIIEDSEIYREDEKQWPPPDKIGKTELIIKMNGLEWKGRTSKIGSLNDLNHCKDPDGLKLYYFLVQDLKSLVLSVMSLHFKIKPI